MRSLRWLLLVALVLVAAAVLGTYRSQRRAVRTRRRPAPPAVALDTKTEADHWEWGQSGNGEPKVKLKAKNMTQAADGEKARLQDIELLIYQKDGLHFDRVRSAAAEFTTSTNKLYSPGEAQITLSVPVSGDPPHQLTSITTSGINFDSKTGSAVSDKHVSFTFANGNGTATGATYDPNSHTLNLDHDVVLHLNGDGPQSKPMTVQAGQLAWNETTSVLLLFPSARLTRDQTVVEAGPSTIQMKDKKITWIDAPQAHGIDKQPGRNLEYSADKIHVDYNDDGKVEKITGEGNAKLIAHGDASQTTMSGNRVDLFVTDTGVLTSAVANGNGYLESKPAPDREGKTADTRILKSDLLHLQMRAGGKELERVSTQSPGTLEFLPNQSARHRRILKADSMIIDYGAKNEIKFFHAAGGRNGVTTETYCAARDAANAACPSYTSSKTVEAIFDEHSQLKEMKQVDNFRYTEGVRKAQANNATLDNDRNIMNLDAHARIADDTGTTEADHIQLQQSTGDFDATGHVSTTRVPDSQKSESAMLDESEPTHGTADHVVSANRNHLIHYIGNAVVWQSANKIQADKIDIDRDKKNIVADGKVVTEFLDSPKEDAPAPASPVFTIVKSQHMVYTDADRLAAYSGGVDFWRPTMTVKSARLQAFLNEKDSGKDSRLDRALGDGKAEILQVTPERRRLGTSEHVEYYEEQGKVILSGGAPQLDDSKRGNTKGSTLTYFTNDNRLLVNGVAEHPAQSHLRKKT